MTEQQVDLGFRPREWQRATFAKLRRFSVLAVHRRAGKTVFAILLLLHHALKIQKERGQFAYVAPLLGQAKQVAWRYLKAYAQKIPGTIVNESELWCEFPNGARIRIHGADNPDSLRGIYFDGVVLDEVAQMRPDTWGEVVRPALADRTGWALFLGTPKGTNLFSELFNKAGRLEDWCAVRLTVDDTQAIPADELDKMRREMSADEIRQELYCDFTVASYNTLISTASVDEARKRVLPRSAWLNSPVILGVDVARFGDDRTCIVRRQGPVVHDLVLLRGADAMEVAGAVAREITNHKPAATFVDGSGGYGAGPIDRLRSLGYRVQEVQFGGKASDARFMNKRAEMWWLMAEWVKTGVLTDHPDWSVDLCSPTYTFANGEGKVALESKAAIKERGLPSPDLGDALALTFAAPVAPPGIYVQGGIPSSGNGLARSSFDPFAG